MKDHTFGLPNSVQTIFFLSFPLSTCMVDSKKLSVTSGRFLVRGTFSNKRMQMRTAKV